MDKKYAQYILQKTKEDYNKIARDFSRTRSFVWEELRVLAKYTKPGDRVLDLGCGNGRLLQIFKGVDINYIGIDNSGELIKIAKERYPNYNFQVTDALNLPFPDNHFDKIYSIAVLHHIPSKELRLQCLKEVGKVLKPSGLLILTVWELRDFKYVYLIIKFAILKLFGLSKLDFGDIFEPWGKKVNRYYHCFTEKELVGLAKKAGFRTKEIGILKNPKGNRQNIYLVAEK